MYIHVTARAHPIMTASLVAGFPLRSSASGSSVQSATSKTFGIEPVPLPRRRPHTCSRAGSFHQAAQSRRGGKVQVIICADRCTCVYRECVYIYIYIYIMYHICALSYMHVPVSRGTVQLSLVYINGPHRIRDQYYLILIIL